MEYDERNRRDPDEDADAAPSEASRPVDPPAGEAPREQPAWPAEPAPSTTSSEPESRAPEPSAPEPPPAPDWGAGEAGSSPPPSMSPSSSEPPPAAADAGQAEGSAWPTEPPAAGSGSEETWPTAAPERSDEPPPSEVEAYPAAPADGGRGDVDDRAPATSAHAVPAGESATGESTQCPRCGTENRPGLAFCRNCGQRLVAAGVASTVERPGTPEGTQACPRCGTHNRAGVAFCQNCGANLRGTAPGYVPPAVAEEGTEAPAATAGGAVLGPVVLIIGLVGIITGYLLPFAGGTGSLLERAMGAGGYGIAFWNGYPEVNAALADQAYFGLAAPAPLFGLLLLVLAVAGFARAVPGMLQGIGLAVALLWSVGLAALFVVVELAANWSGDLVALLRDVSPAGIIFFLASLIVLIGTLTRFGRS